MLSTLAHIAGGRPRRTLVIVALFVVVAGVLGGPVAGSLKSSGGFVPSGSESQVAQNEIQTATGRQPSPGVVLVVTTPRGPRAAAAEIAAVGARLVRVPGIAAVSAPAAVSSNRHQVLVTGTVTASAGRDRERPSAAGAAHPARARGARARRAGHVQRRDR